jgi:hypothetical protein
VAAWLLAPSTITAAVRACAARDSARSRTAYAQEMLRTAIASPSADPMRRAALQVRPRVHRPCFSARTGDGGISSVRKNFTRTRNREFP